MKVSLNNYMTKKYFYLCMIKKIAISMIDDKSIPSLNYLYRHRHNV